jgi:hypothetical protein
MSYTGLYLTGLSEFTVIKQTKRFTEYNDPKTALLYNKTLI